jgi:YidC/Oxa1 family membrane protein insertase
MQDAKNKKRFSPAAVITAVVVLTFARSSFAELNIPPQNASLKAGTVAGFRADDAEYKTFFLGAADPKTENPDKGFRFQMELSAKGASIRKAVFSDGDNKGFNDENYKDPQPLTVLLPAQRPDGSEALSLANTEFIFVQQQLQLLLDKLCWKTIGVLTAEDGSQTAHFETIIRDSATDGPVVKLTKTYKVSPGSYLLDCDVTVENLSAREQKIRFNLAGPSGICQDNERADVRKVVGGFKNSNGQIGSVRLDVGKLHKAKTIDDKRLMMAGGNFLWAAVTDKYFAAILAPAPEKGKDFCDWVTDRLGWFYNPDKSGNADTSEGFIGMDLKIAPITLAPAGQPDSSRTYPFKLYIGPKDKSLFDGNEFYRSLSFVQTIDFMPCFCCPAAVTNPLAFGILSIMKWMHLFIPNYGIVIIILVLLIRLVLHPITRKSQVSMSKMSKLTPQMEEIKKKYADNRVEMNKQMMALYRKHGAVPIMSMLPMLVQMPVWIALYSAIDASVELRGAAFLPFWITNLSAPDVIFRFSAIYLPLFGKLDSINLLPILMGIAFYLQQKLMPAQPAASADSQAAQQQKMMMVMMTVLFPLMLYKAPSGLNLYIMASTFAGVVEQYVIKKHIREKEQQESQVLVAATSKTGGKVKKKKPKPFYKF